MKKRGLAIKWMELPEHVRAMNRHVEGEVFVRNFEESLGIEKEMVRREEKGEERAVRRLRQRQEPVMNKLEERFYEQLKKDKDRCDEKGKVIGEIKIQAVRLELARGIWYKPDFFLVEGKSLRPIAYEVKGPKVFRGGFENLKVAARVHAWIRFYLVWEKTRGGEWERQEVLQ